MLALVRFLTLASIIDIVLGCIPAEWSKKVIRTWDELENLQLLDEINRRNDEVLVVDDVHITHETK